MKKAGVTRKEFEIMAKSLMFEAPGGPSNDKLKALQIAVQGALEKANLIKEAGIDLKRKLQRLNRRMQN